MPNGTPKVTATAKIPLSSGMTKQQLLETLKRVAVPDDACMRVNHSPGDPHDQRDHATTELVFTWEV